MTVPPTTGSNGRLVLGIDPDQLNSCVGCGLCLPHCPTYRISGEEIASPRGRIAAMRLVQDGGLPIDGTFVAAMDACVQCRGCEPACPSGVPYGRLMAATRETLADISPGYRPWWRRAGYRLLGHHRLLLAASSALAVAQRLRLIPPRVRRRTGLPSRLPVRRAALRPTDADDTTREPVWLFTGCVMDAWQRDVHAAVQRVLEAAGAAVTPSAGGASCCGALAEHAGLGDQARSLAARVIRSFPPDAAVLVDSAGCGAMLKDYGHLLGTPEGERFAARVFDVHEWLADPRHPQRLERLASRLDAGGGQPVVAVQDPCHLRHVQRAHLPVRAVLGLVADVRELDDDALCCGAGGAYAVLHPEESARIRDRKLAAIARTGAPLVATANPGCQLHLQAGGLDAHHPLVYVDAALAARRPDRGR